MDINRLLNIIFPPKCIFCDQVMDYRTDLAVCADCVSILPEPQGERCILCLSPIEGRHGAAVCKKCEGSGVYYDGVRAPYLYKEPARSAVIRLKHRCFDYSRTMAEIMCSQIIKANAASLCDLVVPVPMSEKVFKERQYNQAALLAENIAKLLKTEYSENALVKCRETAAQHTLKANMRRENVKGAYITDENTYLGNKFVILVDDVMTTGATLNECAKMLKQAGAAYVFGIVFAFTSYEEVSLEKTFVPVVADNAMPK